MTTPWTQPPKGIRVVYCQDRVVLEDLSPYLGEPPVDRNALIDDVNRSKRANADPPSRCLSLQFDVPGSSPSFHSSETAGVSQGARILGTDVAMGLLGTVDLTSGSSLVLVHSAKVAGALPTGPVYQVIRITLAPLYSGEPTQTDKSIAGEIAKLLESGYVFYSLEADISKSIQSSSQSDLDDPDEEFWWTRALAANLVGAGGFSAGLVARTIYGYIGSCSMSALNGKLSFTFALVSRRSRKRAGTRYITRGADSLGNVANFVETEQVVWAREREYLTSFRVMRGSIPVFWRQNNGLTKPPPELVPPVSASQVAFKSHFDRLQRRFGRVVAVSLVNHQGPEKVLADAFQRHAELDWDHSKPDQTKLVSFDYHAECHGADHDRGLLRLTSLLKEGIQQHKVFVGTHETEGRPLVLQAGVFRVNCVDCLDRTNVVQSIIARGALNMQLFAVFRDVLGSDYAGGRAVPLTLEAEGAFKRVWADNADAISKQYSGTGALKTDVTRTGQRSTTGMLGDGMKSVMRMYYKNVVDQGRQEAIEVLCGYATGAPLPPDKNDVNFSYHDAQRVGAGGDRDPCTLEVRSNSMMLSTAEGIRFDLPRQGIVAWEKRDGVKARPRLRILYDPSGIGSSLIAASPLEFQFKTGGSDREKFIRSVVAWSRPMCLELFHGQLRVRIASFTGSMPQDQIHALSSAGQTREILCVVITDPGPDCRKHGLAAVPLGYGEHGFELITCASNAKSAIALFTTKDLKSAASNVEEAELVLDGDRGACLGISAVVAGKSLCFVGINVLNGGDLHEVLSSVRLGRAGFDISSQFHHCYVVGRLGASSQTRGWTELGDSSWIRTLSDSTGCIRYSLPRQTWTNHILSTTAKDLVDETIAPGWAPDTVKDPVKMSVTFKRLRAEKLRMPSGLPRDTPLLGYMSFSSDYVVEPVSTGTVSRMAQSPEWEDTVVLRLGPSGKQEVLSSYVYGQILISTPVVSDIVAGTFALPVALLVEGKSFSCPVRTGALHGGFVTGLVSVIETLASPESCVMGVSAEVLDIKSRVSNTRKAKNMIGKVSNFLSKKPGDQGPFRSFGEDDASRPSRSAPLQSRGPGGGTNAYQSSRDDRKSLGSEGSLVDLSSMSETLPTSSVHSSRIRSTLDNNLLAAFGYSDDSSQTRRDINEKDDSDEGDSWGDFQGPPSGAKRGNTNSSNNNFIDW